MLNRIVHARTASLPFRTLSFCTALLLSLAVVSGCDSNGVSDGSEVVKGPSVSIEGGGTATAWVRLGPDDQPEALGVSLSEAGYESLTDPGDGHNSGLAKHDGAVIELEMPDQTPAPYNHATLDWNPEGHPPPDIYTVPHFDVHFYFLSPQARDAIQGGPAQTFPDEQYVPSSYAADSVNTPDMGMHYVNLQAPEFNGEPFTHTFIYGFYQGEHTFIEPMVTTDVLSSNPDVNAEVPQPETYQRTGMYPARYRIVHDTEAGEYRVVLADLNRYEGS